MPQLPSGQWSPLAYAEHLAEQLDMVRYAIGHIEQEGRTPNRGEMEAFEEYFRRTLADLEFLLESGGGQGWTNLASETVLAMAESAIMTGIGLEEPFHAILGEYPEADSTVNEVWGNAQLPGREQDFTQTPRLDRLVQLARRGAAPAVPAEAAAEPGPPTLEGLREQAASSALAPAEPAELPSGVQAQLDNVETSLREREGWPRRTRRSASLALVDFLMNADFRAVLETSEDLQNQVRRVVDLVDEDFWEESGDYKQALLEVSDLIDQAEGGQPQEQRLATIGRHLRQAQFGPTMRRPTELFMALDTITDESLGEWPLAVRADLQGEVLRVASTIPLEQWERRRTTLGSPDEWFRNLESMASDLGVGLPNLPARQEPPPRLPRPPAQLGTLAATPAATPHHAQQQAVEQAFLDQLVPELQRVLGNEPELVRELQRRVGARGDGMGGVRRALPPENMQRFLADYFSMTVGDDEFKRLLREQGRDIPYRWSQGGPLQRYFVIREPEGVVPVVRTAIDVYGDNKIYLSNLENMAPESLRKMGGSNAALRALSESLDREGITVGGSPGAFNDAGLPTGSGSDAGKRVEDLPDYREGHGAGHPTLHWFYARLGFDWRTGERAPRSPWPRPLPTLEGVDPVAWNRRDFIGGAVNTKRQRIARKGAERAETTASAEREKRWGEMQQRELEKMDPAARARHEAAGRAGVQLPLPGMMPEGPDPAPEGYEPPPPPEVPAQQAPEGGPIRVQIGANNFLEYASPQQQRALLNSRMEDVRTNLARGDTTVFYDLISQRRALRQHGPDAAPYLIDLDLAIDSGLTTLREENHPAYRPLYDRAVDAGVDVGAEATSQIPSAEPTSVEEATQAINEIMSGREPPPPAPAPSPTLPPRRVRAALDNIERGLESPGHRPVRLSNIWALGDLIADHQFQTILNVSADAQSQVRRIVESVGAAEWEEATRGVGNPQFVETAGTQALIDTFERMRDPQWGPTAPAAPAPAPAAEPAAAAAEPTTVPEAQPLWHPLVQREFDDLERLLRAGENDPISSAVTNTIYDQYAERLGNLLHGRGRTGEVIRSERGYTVMPGDLDWTPEQRRDVGRHLQAIPERGWVHINRNPYVEWAQTIHEYHEDVLGEPAPGMPAAEPAAAAAAPEGRTVQIDNNPWSGDRSFTISVPEAVEEARQHLELARTQHGTGSNWAAHNLLLADGVLRALHPVVGQTGEMEELSSQYRDLLRQVSEEDLREVAARAPAMEVPVREAIQGRQLTQHADVIERELQRLLREEPIMRLRSPETAERIAGLRESRQSLEDARGKLGRATPWLIGAALKGGVKPGVAQAEEMGVERSRVEARQEAPPPVEAPAPQKPPRPLPMAEPAPGTSVVPPAPPGPDAPPPPQPKAGTVEPARAYETPRAAKEAPAVRQAQSAHDAIQKKFPEALRSIEVEAAVRQGDEMMRKARTLEGAGKHAEALRYREAARLNFQSLERVAKLKGLTRTASRALGYASLPLIALDAYGMTKQAMEEGPAAVGRQVAEGMEEVGRGIGRVALPKKAEEALGLDEPGTLRSERVGGSRQEQADASLQRTKEAFMATPGGLSERERRNDDIHRTPASESPEGTEMVVWDNEGVPTFLQERERHWSLTDPEELAKKRREAAQKALAPQ